MGVAFFVAGAIALILSAIRYEVVYRSLIDSFPPQFQEDQTSRYAFPVLALSPSTPLSSQADYMKALWGSCVGCLCICLGFFASQNVSFGLLCLLGFFWAVFSTFKSWKIYRENCSRNRSTR